MTHIEFLKVQSKNLLRDYKTQFVNEEEGGILDYKPKFFSSVDAVFNFEFLGFEEEKMEFSLMKAQHIVAKLAGFKNWGELVKASESAQELGKLLFVHRNDFDLCLDEGPSGAVEFWKVFIFENDLGEMDDVERLNAFKQVLAHRGKMRDREVKMLAAGKNPYKVKPVKYKLNLSEYDVVQDMAASLMKEKRCSAEKAVQSSINAKIFVRVSEVGDAASFALSLWGHEDPEREYEKLENPILMVNLTEEKQRLLSLIKQQQNISTDEAISYFLLSTLESLGYHI